MSVQSTAAFLQLIQPYGLVSGSKIRVGPDTDGGYVLADILRDDQIVLSYGLSWNVGFDLALAQRGHIVHMFDHTIPGIPVEHPNFRYHKQGVAGRPSEDEQLDTLEKHFSLYAPNCTSIILKIDVEGAEWESIDAISDADLARVEQIVLEVHDLCRCKEDAFRERATRVFEKINRQFNLIHVHANNCAPIIAVDGFPVADVMELTYLRKSSGAVEQNSDLYPTEFDGPNNPTLEDYPLWFYPFAPLRTEASQLSRVYSREIKRLQVVNELTHLRFRFAEANASVATPMRGWKPFGRRARGPLNILILSVHPVLEYDETVMLEANGHNVFSLGFYTNRNNANTLRPNLSTTEWHDGKFSRLVSDGIFERFHETQRWMLTPGFLDGFDVVLVHHDVDFIRENAALLAGLPTIWRGIGQESPGNEQALAELRQHGVRIVRWSPVQRDLPNYAGSDVVIRAAKDPDELSGWVGNDATVVTFAHDFEKRGGSLAYDFWADCVAPFKCELYGLRNEGIPAWHGELDYAAQKDKLRSARVTLVTGSRPAPYNLSFIEAWMIGTPVVHIGPTQGSGSTPGTWEISDLIETGVNGYVVEDVLEAQRIIRALLQDDALALRISEAGRRSAIETFGVSNIRRAWSDFFVDTLS